MTDFDGKSQVGFIAGLADLAHGGTTADSRRRRSKHKLTHGSLFSGIGGFDLGFQWASIRTVWQVEQSEFCRTILERHFPHAKRHNDVREVGAENLCRVDIVSGGSPCQDLSPASPRRAGLDGERSGLWREMHRICAELIPPWVIFENVPGLRARGADTIAAAMEDLGYSCTAVVVGAHMLGAPHRRDRIWLVCHLDGADDFGARGIGSLSLQEERELDKAQQAWGRLRLELGGAAGDDGRPSYQAIRREFYGVPHRLDRRALAALGNSVIPQIPMMIGSFIRQYEQGGPGRKDPSPVLGAPMPQSATYQDWERHHSIEGTSVEWYTPTDISEAARMTMGSLDLDPCTIATNPTGARLYYTKETNGLDKPWFGNVWLNPPFGEGFVQWMHKVNQEIASGRVSQIICLIPVWTNAKWFQSFGHRDVSLCFPRPIRFINGTTMEPGNPAMSPNVIVYIGTRHREFAQQFRQFGLVVRGLSNQ